MPPCIQKIVDHGALWTSNVSTATGSRHVPKLLDHGSPRPLRPCSDANLGGPRRNPHAKGADGELVGGVPIGCAQIQNGSQTTPFEQWNT
eukprot:4749355-Pyramimonas_sp.AAC.1